MDSSVRQPALRAALLLATCLAAAWVLVETTGSLRHPATRGFADLLTASAAWLLIGCATWAILLTTAALAETTTAGRVRATAWVGCPRSWRRVLVAGVGVALVGGVSGPTSATATVTASETASSADRAAGSWQRVLPVPARPVGRVASGRSPRVLVRPGDTLWHLAADRLPPSSSDGEVTHLVERVHQRNRVLIGPDPDLIHPGQRLVFPMPAQHE